MDEWLDLMQLMAGDNGAWNAFVLRYAAVIQAAVVTVLRNSRRESESADLVQDVFLRLIKDNCRLLAQYDPRRASPVTWLTVVSRSVATDALRRRFPGAQVPLDEVPERSIAVAPTETEHLTFPADLLTPRQQLVMAMLYDRDMSPTEIARVIGVDAQTVRSTHHKALSRLRAHFAATAGQ